jgi:hypothetical protein
MQNLIRVIPTVLKAVATVVLLTVVTMVCEDPPSGPETEIEPPDIKPQPAHQATDVATSPLLAWPCPDPADRSLRYDLYFGEVDPPALLASGLTDTVFAPDQLMPGQIYHWRVVTQGGRRFPVSKMWNFTTRTITYPVRLHNWWEYSYTFWHENMVPADLELPIDDSLMGFAQVGVAEVLTGVDFPLTHRFHVLDHGPQMSCEEDDYYVALSHGLYLVDRTGPCTDVTPKLGSGVSYHWGGRVFHSVEELFGSLGDGPALAASDPYEYLDYVCLQYPLHVGAKWTYLYMESPTLRIDHRVVDWRRREVPAGSFDCFTIQWLWDLDADGVWDDLIEKYDYIAAEGLVKRTLRLRDVIIYDYHSPYPVGMADYVWEANLTDLFLSSPDLEP